MSNLWKSLWRKMRTQLNFKNAFKNAYHPWIDVQIEMINHNLDNLL